MFVRASTQEQDATGSEQPLSPLRLSAAWQWQRSILRMNRGGSLKRPELGDCIRGDVLLIKQVDRLLRLSYAGWEALKCEVGARGDVRIVELDLPTSWQCIITIDEITPRILAAIARKGLHRLLPSSS